MDIGFKGDKASALMRQIAGILARRIVCRARSGERMAPDRSSA